MNARREVRVEQRGVRTETWTIGKHIVRETYEQCKDVEGEIYVAIAYEHDEPKVRVVPKADWKRLVKG
jgi:hypothetical protein